VARRRGDHHSSVLISLANCWPRDAQRPRRAWSNRPRRPRRWRARPYGLSERSHGERDAAASSSRSWRRRSPPSPRPGIARHPVAAVPRQARRRDGERFIAHLDGDRVSARPIRAVPAPGGPRRAARPATPKPAL